MVPSQFTTRNRDKFGGWWAEGRSVPGLEQTRELALLQPF
jgi:hypothetical protein